MTTLILCTPRTGSNSFIKALSKSLNTPHISIPDSYSFEKDSSFIKSILGKQNIIFRMSPIHNVGYTLEEFCLFFDKLIFLSRKNNKEHYESLVNLYYREHFLGYGTKGSYVYEDIPTEILPQLEQEVNWEEINTQKLQIEDLSRKFNKKVIYYEDLFYSEIAVNILSKQYSNFNSSIFKKYLESTSKLRINRVKTML